MHLKQRIPATLEEVSRLVEKLQAVFAAQGISDHALIALAVQELGVNIVTHAYEGQEQGEIEFESELTRDTLEIWMRDQGLNVYIPPVEIVAPDPLDLPEGGWGIYLIYQIIDQVSYTSRDDTNEWHLKKHLVGKTG